MCVPTVNAQDYLIHQFPKLDTIPKEYGPNLKNYEAMIYGLGALFGNSDSSGSNINPGKSFYVTYGARYKNKVTKFLNTGFDFMFEYRNFNLAQTNKKVFADTIIHKKERYMQLTVGAGYFLRFNLTKRRGNHLGKYIDVYCNGYYSPINRYYVYDKLPKGSGARHEKLMYRKLEFANPFWAQTGLRYGISFFQFQAFYRFTNMFKKPDKFSFPELPRFGAGILIDLEVFN
ncbi:MAG TPA: hypothetical protein VK177_03885 [Flavobacteriales bacterium]|nr:hypothetical protein [Flavobacteriales bacterium]